MDHASQYAHPTSAGVGPRRPWAIHPSFGFVEAPQTNGVVERWNRTLKEQAIYRPGLSTHLA